MSSLLELDSLNENSIENVSSNLNSSFDRLERLFTEEWIMK